MPTLQSPMMRMVEKKRQPTPSAMPMFTRTLWSAGGGGGGVGDKVACRVSAILTINKFVYLHKVIFYIYDPICIFLIICLSIIGKTPSGGSMDSELSQVLL